MISILTNLNDQLFIDFRHRTLWVLFELNVITSSSARIYSDSVTAAATSGMVIITALTCARPAA